MELIVYPLHESQSADKSRNLPGQLHNWTLHLRHQLQEGGQHAECHRTGVQPVYSPCESGHIAKGAPAYTMIFEKMENELRRITSRFNPD